MAIMSKNELKNLSSVQDEEEDTSENVPNEILVLAQEVKIVQSLACNDMNKRNRQIRKLRNWLKLRSRSTFKFTDEDFLRIWKGLYYCMWMSDKPLVQEELAEQLGQFLLCFDADVGASCMFFGSFMRTMSQEWFGIDQWRMDKFLMLVRRMLRSMFRVLKDNSWSKNSLQKFNEQIEQYVLTDSCSSRGLTMHFLDVFFEELSKVADGNITAEQVGAFIRPFVTFIATQRDAKLTSHCRSRVLYHLLYQSELGREYTDKYNAWKDMGFPTASIHDLEKDDSVLEDGEGDDDEEDDNTAENAEQQLDPRAGDVDVFMPLLPLEGKYVIDPLEKLLYKSDLNTKCRKMLKKILDFFKVYQNGEFPLGVKVMPRYTDKSERPLIKDKIEQLDNMENEIYGTGRKLKQMTKRKRRQLLKSLNYEKMNEENLDEVIEKSLPKQYMKERRKRAQAAMLYGWVEEELDSSETGGKLGKKQTKKTKGNKLDKQNAKKIKKVNDEPSKKMRKIDESGKKIKKIDDATKTFGSNIKSDAINIDSTNEWNKPLSDGEIEYFIPTRKLQLKKANANLVLNPLAKKSPLSSPSTPKQTKQTNSAISTPSSSVKRVKIALKNNTAQNPSEYIRQIKNSPNVPYDASKKPGRGLLKPNLMPTPINPFYKKKIGLRLLNDSN